MVPELILAKPWVKEYPTIKWCLAPNIQIIAQDDQLMLEVYDYTELERILSGSLKQESDFNSSSKRIAYLLKRLVIQPPYFSLTAE